ncbi:virion structural protein [Achromobacter phage vB_AxyP_19-32_Axy12]|nr:virion structural protein [Achromobacter phage phiAxp-3]YP_010079109.1 virion structural protein [Achromobacter phage vB_AxyP_19-32_Axy12]ALA45527.1 hypothetical protein ADP65_00058 [Achromobacter phage phiAxp-3]QDH84097.1 hypothetical protein Axy12_061 [Achromobacter phage vB_AxyP_19-32_Axy12]
MACGAELEANSLLTALLQGENFELPDIDMSGTDWDLPGGINNPVLGEIPRLTNDDLTTKSVDGTGTFDYLMKSVSEHLKAEFKANRITGADYVRAYIELTEAAMNNATQFLVQRDGAFYQAALVQMQVLNQRAALAIAKAQFVNMKFEALTAKSNYALTKLKLSTESAGYCTAQYNLSTMLPQQFILLKEQTANAVETTKLTTGQIAMVREQMESQRSQTTDVRSDGLPVTGLTGKQKQLYDQQITSYKRDAEVKAAKLFTDAWITQKTIDEGLSPPNNFANPSLDAILGTLKSNNALG